MNPIERWCEDQLLANRDFEHEDVARCDITHRGNTEKLRGGKKFGRISMNTFSEDRVKFTSWNAEVRYDGEELSINSDDSHVTLR